MFRKNPHVSPLQVRKKLLLAESELHRAELVRELKELKGEVEHIKSHLKTVGSIASSAALAASAFSLFRRHLSRNGSGKPSWISTALAGARIGTSLFLKVKSLFRDRE